MPRFDDDIQVLNPVKKFIMPFDGEWAISATLGAKFVCYMIDFCEFEIDN
jgi:hypothetical protein